LISKNTAILNKPWKPKEVVERASTDFLGVTDKIVINALQYIHRNFKSQLTTADVLSALKVSRPTLDNHFKAVLKRTVAEEITRIRLKQAKRLLASTDMTIDAVALECGFINPDRLYRIFHRHVGFTPGEYRSTQTQ